MEQTRHLKQRIHEQSIKIKELEDDWLDEYTKCQLMGKEIDKLNRIIKFIQRGMDGNEQFEQVLKDLEGGHEEKFYCNDGENFKFGALERCSTQCESCKIGGKESQEVNRSEESSNGFNTDKMSEKQQTAIEWLLKKISSEYRLVPNDDIIEQAKELEKKQIEDAYLDGYCETAKDSQDYYSKTYSK